MLPVIDGTATGIFAHALLAGFGVTQVFARSPLAMEALRAFGTVYLLWLAFNLIRKGFRASPGTYQRETIIGSREALVGNLINVKPVLLYLTIVPIFAGSNMLAYCIAALIHVGMMAAFLLLNGALVSMSQLRLKGSLLEALITISGGILLMALTLRSAWQDYVVRLRLL